jgi:hypothetical protein
MPLATEYKKSLVNTYDLCLRVRSSVKLKYIILEDEPNEALEALLTLRKRYNLFKKGPESSDGVVIEDYKEQIADAIDEIVAHAGISKGYIEYLTILMNTAVELYKKHEENKERSLVLDVTNANYDAFKKAIRWAQEKGDAWLTERMQQSLIELFIYPIEDIAKEDDAISQLEGYLRKFDVANQKELVVRAKEEFEGDDKIISIIDRAFESTLEYAPNFKLVDMSQAEVDPLYNPPAGQTSAITSQSNTDKPTIAEVDKTLKKWDKIKLALSAALALITTGANLFFSFPSILALPGLAAVKMGAQKAAEKTITREDEQLPIKNANR